MTARPWADGPAGPQVPLGWWLSEKRAGTGVKAVNPPDTSIPENISENVRYHGDGAVINSTKVHCTGSPRRRRSKGPPLRAERPGGGAPGSTAPSRSFPEASPGSAAASQRPHETGAITVPVFPGRTLSPERCSHRVDGDSPDLRPSPGLRGLRPAADGPSPHRIHGRGQLTL